MKRAIRITSIVVGGLFVVAGLAFGIYVYQNTTFAERYADDVADAGVEEKQVTVNGSRMNYAEGPDNGPALLLIHGQVTDWRNWSLVLPQLAERYHVFAVDCYGHGKSEHVPEKYTANALAADMKSFLTDVVGEPALVAGHSSGGLVAAGLAADAPELLRGVVLEDPPFFSSVLPAAEKTFNYVDLSTPAHDFLRSGESDFTSFYVEHSAIWKLFGPVGPRVKENALRYRRDHPDEPVELFYMPPLLNEPLRAVGQYDPRFGEAFYTNEFHDDFDHADVLSRISVPAVLIHTNWQYDKDGILLASMSGADAKRARSLIEDVRFHKVDSGHGFHFEKPDQFIDIVEQFESELSKP